MLEKYEQGREVKHNFPLEQQLSLFFRCRHNSITTLSCCSESCPLYFRNLTVLPHTCPPSAAHSHQVGRCTSTILKENLEPGTTTPYSKPSPCHSSSRCWFPSAWSRTTPISSFWLIRDWWQSSHHRSWQLLSPHMQGHLLVTSHWDPSDVFCCRFWHSCSLLPPLLVCIGV